MKSVRELLISGAAFTFCFAMHATEAKAQSGVYYVAYEVSCDPTSQYYNQQKCDLDLSIQLPPQGPAPVCSPFPEITYFVLGIVRPEDGSVFYNNDFDPFTVIQEDDFGEGVAMPCS